ncbi:MAG: hypothetical protein BJ554DRAFT_6765 [Olpidium bornovanus]|uniref:Uncharacterized protein n=1 Tax=Olpidium bornovanus TaxID=278681 RepID=A0A8H7ZX92_9FUNG|nr:MAG: hypothetical protein BJ554DRAFT_6765 [Olpidium bornovanus]
MPKVIMDGARADAKASRPCRQQREGHGAAGDVNVKRAPFAAATGNDVAIVFRSGGVVACKKRKQKPSRHGLRHLRESRSFAPVAFRGGWLELGRPAEAANFPRIILSGKVRSVDAFEEKILKVPKRHSASILRNKIKRSERNGRHVPQEAKSSPAGLAHPWEQDTRGEQAAVAGVQERRQTYPDRRGELRRGCPRRRRPFAGRHCPRHTLRLPQRTER